MSRNNAFRRFISMMMKRIHSMKPFVSILVTAMMFFTFTTCFSNGLQAATADENMHGLPLSDMQVKITSQGHTAIFQLYDTVAAEELFNQLPLRLDLDNFRDAQWMFYPPEKLHVTPHEAYHDGKKGELSYYAPWGDVFMLYKDFHAGDEMHRLGIGLTGLEDIALMSGDATIEKNQPNISGNKTAMFIQVLANDMTTVFKLNESQASKELYAQLPLSIAVEDYGGKEKIFYPPKKLGTSGTPSANAQAGTIAYYAPWGDVVMFYKKFGSASGLYELGEAVSGSENIQKMSGKIEIDKSSGQ